MKRLCYSIDQPRASGPATGGTVWRQRDFPERRGYNTR